MRDLAKEAASEDLLAEETDDNAQAVLGAMLLRAGLIDQAMLDRSERMLGKLGDNATLYEVLLKFGKLTEESMLDCIREYHPDISIGNLLVALGMLDRNQLWQALQLQKHDSEGLRIGEVLVNNKMMRERDFTRVLAAQLGYHYEDLDIDKCNPASYEKFTLKTLQNFGFLPLRAQEDKTVVAFTDPSDQISRNEAARALETPLIPVMVSHSAFRNALASVARRREHRGPGDSRKAGKDSATGLVNLIISSAVSNGASDIHVEPLREVTRIRFRIDGVLREQVDINVEDLASLVSRLKVMAEADLAERRRHQDGKIEFEDPVSGKITLLRASFYVTVYGESVVLRIMNQNSKIPDLAHVGMESSVLNRFTRLALESPTGVIVITGPTGSGKTSTLFSCIKHLNDETCSIITAEDPVEFQVDGISQCSVSNKIGRTYEETLKHIVRQDPDIIVLGEMRDALSARSAIQAALTGHKVLTTFHTEDSIGALLRLLNMDIEPFLISSTITCIVAQRLVRKICSECAEPAKVESSELSLLGWSLEDAKDARFMQGGGCTHCHFSGYRGRVAVLETLILNEPVRDAILEGKSASELRRICIGTSGTITLLESGLIKAARGETSLAEIRRTLPRVGKPRSLLDLQRLTGARG